MNRSGRATNLSVQQRHFHSFLLSASKKNSTFLLADISRETEWTLTSVKAYFSKGHWDALVIANENGTFSAGEVSELSETEFLQALTQSQRARELGGWCKHPLTRALLAKSRDNMTLALELFNRPSIENRVDAFVILFVVAWEQLLKAMVIEASGELAIFREHRPGKKRETIGLRECLQKVSSLSERERKNLETIQRLRDEATHLLVPETAGTPSYIFQAGVINFGRCFATFARARFLPVNAIGLLTLVSDAAPPTVAVLRRQYGKRFGPEIDSLLTSLRAEVQAENHADYAIPLEYKLTFAKSAAAGDIELVKAANAPAGVTGIVVEKPMNMDHTHPHHTVDIVPMIDQALQSAISKPELEKRLGRPGKTEKHRFTSADFQALVQRTGWKNTNSEFHFLITKPETHRYSDAAVREAVRLLETDPDYLRDASAKKRARATRGK